MRAWACIFVLVFLEICAPAQTTILGFKSFVFYTTPEMERGQTNRLKTIISGESAQVLGNGLYHVTKPRIQHFDATAQTNLVAASPECLFDPTRNTVSSTNVLVAVAGTNQMRIEGRGYFGMLTNLYLIFSNDVTTLIRQEAMQSARAPGSLLGGGKPSAGRTNASLVVTNSDIHIKAEHLHLNYQSNLATYYRNVQVDNAQVRLTSEQLEIKRSKTNNLESILAETNVVVRHKLEPSEAFGDRAYYYLQNGQEMLELSGQPARWQDADRGGKAGQFTYQLGERILLAENEAMFRFPRRAMSQTDWLPGRAHAAKTNAPVSTNEFLEVHAQTITSWLSTSNRPGNRMLAETNVLILGSGDQTRATADRATYNELLGEMDLLGQAEWQQGLRTVKGDRLHYDRTNQIFLAQGNAHLKVPVAEFGQQTRTNSLGGTNRIRADKGAQFLETYSDRFEYRGGYLTFYDNVRGTLLESNVPHGMMTAAYVRVKMSNQIERIIARDKVHVEEFPLPTASGKAVSKKLDCGSLTIDLRTNGWVHRVLAQTNVVAQQTRKASAKAKPSYSRLTAESVFAEFFAHTNDVREIIAERDVFLMQDQNTAIGQKAVYTATNGLVVLTGNPSLDSPKLRLDKAEAIIWNRITDTFSFRGPTGGEAQPPENTQKRLSVGK